MRTELPVNERLKNVPFPDPSINAIDSPVETVYYLPDRIYTSDDLTNVKLGVWDYENKKWSTDQIGGQLQFNKETRQINFTTTKFAPIAMLQSRCMDYPYQDWKLRCVDSETAILDLTTKRMSLVFEIGPRYLKLIECGAKELSHLMNTEYQPGFLLQELSKCGVHLLPRDEDAKLAGIELKDRAAEERAILDICINVRAVHFRKAKWNQGAAGQEGIGAQQVLMKIRENLEFDRVFQEDYEPDWRYMSWWCNKVGFIKGARDVDPTCSAELIDGEVYHALMAQTVEIQCSP
jgi:hypothetical protein